MENDNGKNISETVKILTRLRNEAFEGRDEQLALALGRPLEEVASWERETAEIDEDAVMKIHALAEERLSK